MFNCNTKASIIPEKVNRIIEANTKSLKKRLNMLIIESGEKQQEIINTSANKNIFLKN